MNKVISKGDFRPEASFFLILPRRIKILYSSHEVYITSTLPSDENKITLRVNSYSNAKVFTRKARYYPSTVTIIAQRHVPGQKHLSGDIEIYISTK